LTRAGEAATHPLPFVGMAYVRALREKKGPLERE
jgi:hypothetical protein